MAEHKEDKCYEYENRLKEEKEAWSVFQWYLSKKSTLKRDNTDSRSVVWNQSENLSLVHLKKKHSD